MLNKVDIFNIDKMQKSWFFNHNWSRSEAMAMGSETQRSKNLNQSIN